MTLLVSKIAIPVLGSQFRDLLFFVLAQPSLYVILKYEICIFTLVRRFFRKFFLTREFGVSRQSASRQPYLLEEKYNEYCNVLNIY
jgi:hypothetical protein